MEIRREPMELIEVEDHSVKSIKEVVYLGVMFTAAGRLERELVRRIGIATSALLEQCIWKQEAA